MVFSLFGAPIVVETREFVHLRLVEICWRSNVDVACRNNFAHDGRSVVSLGTCYFITRTGEGEHYNVKSSVKF